jgi:hypothetical protein
VAHARLGPRLHRAHDSRRRHACRGGGRGVVGCWTRSGLRGVAVEPFARTRVCRSGPWGVCVCVCVCVCVRCIRVRRGVLS